MGDPGGTAGAAPSETSLLGDESSAAGVEGSALVEELVGAWVRVPK